VLKFLTNNSYGFPLKTSCTPFLSSFLLSYEYVETRINENFPTSLRNTAECRSHIYIYIYKGGMAFQNLVEKKIITALVPASIVIANDTSS
jgi:hypothetical protein